MPLTSPSTNVHILALAHKKVSDERSHQMPLHKSRIWPAATIASFTREICSSTFHPFCFERVCVCFLWCHVPGLDPVTPFTCALGLRWVLLNRLINRMRSCTTFHRLINIYYDFYPVSIHIFLPLFCTRCALAGAQLCFAGHSGNFHSCPSIQTPTWLHCCKPNIEMAQRHSKIGRKMHKCFRITRSAASTRDRVS